MGTAGKPVRKATAPRSWVATLRIFSSFGDSFVRLAHDSRIYRTNYNTMLRPFSVALLRKLNHSMTLPERGGPKLRATLRMCRGTLITLGVFSGVSNILMLTGSIFMLEIYDRVLPSRNVATLIGLSVLVLILFSFQGAIDVVRGRINSRIGRLIDGELSQQVYAAIIQMPLKARGDGDGMQPLRDLDQVRSFLSSWGPSAFFDLPWMPLYLIICFLFHFWIGMTALIGTIVLVAVTLVTEFKTQEPTKVAAGFARTRSALAVAGRRNAEVLQAMGMSGRAAAIWGAANRNYLLAHESASDVATSLGGFSRVFRMMLQSAVLAVGAVLVIHDEATAGIIIASSILTSRALAPVELAIANWKGFVAARQSANRLNKLLTLFPDECEPLMLPPPKMGVSVQAISVNPPGEQRLVVNNVSFEISAGQGLGIIGPSGSGKTSLARALVGVWQPVRGKVRLDDAALEHWSHEARGRHIGYLPQDVELFEGSIAENICRFDKSADPKAILGAAQAANVHRLILTFHAGYATRIGEGGMALSAGQRQRIALARALFGNPFFIVLDEPSSNLDSEGEEALTQAILGVRDRGGVAIVIAHRPSALAAVDQVLVMENGAASMFGKKDDVLRAVMRPVPLPAATLPRVTAHAVRR
jgi:PrtD family type I secretion system ABC transporter